MEAQGGRQPSPHGRPPALSGRGMRPPLGTRGSGLSGTVALLPTGRGKPSHDLGSGLRPGPEGVARPRERPSEPALPPVAAAGRVSPRALRSSFRQGRTGGLSLFAPSAGNAQCEVRSAPSMRRGARPGERRPVPSRLPAQARLRWQRETLPRYRLQGLEAYG